MNDLFFLSLLNELHRIKLSLSEEKEFLLMDRVIELIKREYAHYSDDNFKDLEGDR